MITQADDRKASSACFEVSFQFVQATYYCVVNKSSVRAVDDDVTP